MPNLRQCRDGEQASILKIINLAAQRYHGVIPADCWHEPYMPAESLVAEIAAGVEFWGASIIPFSVRAGATTEAAPPNQGCTGGSAAAVRDQRL